MIQPAPLVQNLLIFLMTTSSIKLDTNGLHLPFCLTSIPGLPCCPRFMRQTIGFAIPIAVKTLEQIKMATHRHDVNQIQQVLRSVHHRPTHRLIDLPPSFQPTHNMHIPRPGLLSGSPKRGPISSACLVPFEPPSFFILQHLHLVAHITFVVVCQDHTLTDLFSSPHKTIPVFVVAFTPLNFFNFCRHLYLSPTNLLSRSSSIWPFPDALADFCSSPDRSTPMFVRFLPSPVAAPFGQQIVPICACRTSPPTLRLASVSLSTQVRMLQKCASQACKLSSA